MKPKKAGDPGVADRLKALQYTMKASAREMYDALEVSKGTYSKYVNAEAVFDYMVILRLIERFNCDPLWLMTGQGEMFLPSPDDLKKHDDKMFEMSTLLGEILRRLERLESSR
jgi:transcriptional regulator with XRE-family HTH domain